MLKTLICDVSLIDLLLQNGSGGEEFPPVAVKTEHSYSISGGGAVSSSNSNVSSVACTSSSASSAAINVAAVANNLYFANGNCNGAGSDGDSEPASPLSLEDGE